MVDIGLLRASFLGGYNYQFRPATASLAFGFLCGFAPHLFHIFEVSQCHVPPTGFRRCFNFSIRDRFHCSSPLPPPMGGGASSPCASVLCRSLSSCSCVSQYRDRSLAVGAPDRCAGLALLRGE